MENIRRHKIMGDERGKLIALESSLDVPFEIRRVFYIFGTDKNVSRGNHAHFKARQYLVSLNGSCKITFSDGLGTETTYLLDSPEIGLLQEPLIWGKMHDFSRDNVLLVLSDMYYDTNDYINSYTQFVRLVTDGKNTSAG